MPDDPDTPESLPSRHRPRLSELSRQTMEEDLWDIGEEGEAQDSSAGPVTGNPPAPPQAVEPRTPRAEDGLRIGHGGPPDVGAGADAEDDDFATPTPAQKVAVPRPAATVQAKPGPTPTPTPEGASAAASAAPRPVTEQAPEPDPEPAEASPGSRRSDAGAPPPSPAGFSRRDRIGLGICAGAVLGIALWWGIGLFSDIHTTRRGDDQPDLPAEGSFATVAAIETYWRAPVREGEHRDVARAEVSTIPALTVTLGDARSGALRVIFRNTEGEFVGDGITRAFSNGKFDLNGSPTIEFPATDGFIDNGDFDAYRVGTDRWSIEVIEGPSANAAGREFKSLFTAPISPNRR